ncbi:titin homolog [Physella acuta]|uniref:titin homolog n=1 Tax=Physella acuta TaxID=109671 RepID=UPI0027DC304A|nr:titin homolog [Physella acuta]
MLKARRPGDGSLQSRDDDPLTSRADDPVTSRADDPLTSRADDSLTSRADDPNTSRADDPDTSRADDPSAATRQLIRALLDGTPVDATGLPGRKRLSLDNPNDDASVGAPIDKDTARLISAIVLGSGVDIKKADSKKFKQTDKGPFDAQADETAGNRRLDSRQQPSVNMEPEAEADTSLAVPGDDGSRVKSDRMEGGEKREVSEKGKKSEVSEKEEKSEVSEKEEKSEVSEKEEKSEVSEKGKKSDVSEKEDKLKSKSKVKNMSDVKENDEKVDVLRGKEKLESKNKDKVEPSGRKETKRNLVADANSENTSRFGASLKSEAGETRPGGRHKGGEDFDAENSRSERQNEPEKYKTHRRHGGKKQENLDSVPGLNDDIIHGIEEETKKILDLFKSEKRKNKGYNILQELDPDDLQQFGSKNLGKKFDKGRETEGTNGKLYEMGGKSGKMKTVVDSSRRPFPVGRDAVRVAPEAKRDGVDSAQAKPKINTAPRGRNDVTADNKMLKDPNILGDQLDGRERVRKVDAMPFLSSILDTPDVRGGRSTSQERSKDNKPAQSKDNRPAQSKDNKPTQSKDNRPAQSKDNRPAQIEDNRPAQIEDNKPAQIEDNRPAQSKDNRSAQSKDNRPAQSQDNRPAQSQDNRPAQSKDNRPAQSEDNRPAQSKDNRPALSKDNRPEPSKDNRPAQSIDKKAEQNKDNKSEKSKHTKEGAEQSKDNRQEKSKDNRSEKILLQNGTDRPENAKDNKPDQSDDGEEEQSKDNKPEQNKDNREKQSKGYKKEQSKVKKQESEHSKGNKPEQNKDNKLENDTNNRPDHSDVRKEKQSERKGDTKLEQIENNKGELSKAGRPYQSKDNLAEANKDKTPEKGKGRPKSGKRGKGEDKTHIDARPDEINKKDKTSKNHDGFRQPLNHDKTKNPTPKTNKLQPEKNTDKTLSSVVGRIKKAGDKMSEESARKQRGTTDYNQVLWELREPRPPPSLTDDGPRQVDPQGGPSVDDVTFRDISDLASTETKAGGDKYKIISRDTERRGRIHQPQHKFRSKSWMPMKLHAHSHYYPDIKHISVVVKPINFDIPNDNLNVKVHVHNTEMPDASPRTKTRRLHLKRRPQSMFPSIRLHRDIIERRALNPPWNTSMTKEADDRYQNTFKRSTVL